MKEIIHNWLNGNKSFTIGAILYQRYGTDEQLKELFERGRSDFAEKLLLKELSSMIDNKAKEVKQRSLSSAEFPESKDRTIQALRDQWMPLYTQMNYKRHQLDRFLNQKTDAARHRRGKLAMEILQLEKDCMRIWAQRDHYIEFGHLPGIVKTDPVIDPAKVIERYKNVQGYLRRYKMYLKKDPGNAKNIELLKQYEEEFQQLKQKREELI